MSGPRIGLFGPCCNGDVHRLLGARIVEAEIRRRVPSATVERYAVPGCDDLVALDAGRRPRSAGPWTPARTAELAGRLDLGVVDAGLPLPDTGVEGAAWHRADDADPDPLVLTSRLLDAALLAKRLRFLRAAGWFPPVVKPILVVAGAWVDDGIDVVARAVASHLDEHGPRPVVVVETAERRADGGRVDAAVAALGGDTFRLPFESTVEDVVAAFAHAECIVGASPRDEALALSFVVPSVPVDDASDDGSISRARSASHRIDRSLACTEHTAIVDLHLDRIVDRALDAWERGLDPSDAASAGPRRLLAELDAERADNDALRLALDGMQDRALAERLAFAELHLGATTDDHADFHALFDLRDRNARQQARIAELEAVVAALEQSQVDALVDPSDLLAARAETAAAREAEYAEHLRHVVARDELDALRRTKVVRGVGLVRRVAVRLRPRP